MPNEQTNFEAVRNRLLNKAREHDEKAKLLRHAAQNAEEALRLANGEECEPVAPRRMAGRGHVEDGILRWAAEREGGWRAEEAKEHLVSLGYDWKEPYKNTYEALLRLCRKGKLVRLGEMGQGRFYLPGQVQTEN
jgi:hypothetical protein